MKHHFIRAFILVCFSLMILYIERTDSLSLYVDPYLVPLVKLSAAGLLIAGLFQLHTGFQMRRHRHDADCACGHSHHPSSALQSLLLYGLFALPLLLAFLPLSGQ
ncbi:DUF1980 domain-containing protein [Paenibacillus paeoniae]|nr:DUF1980 domain-containing protein [Paenibacillus paeoniae]